MTWIGYLLVILVKDVLSSRYAKWLERMVQLRKEADEMDGYQFARMLVRASIGTLRLYRAAGLKPIKHSMLETILRLDHLWEKDPQAFKCTIAAIKLRFGEVDVSDVLPILEKDEDHDSG
ncbi:MAG: hypothetical protein BA066_07220 [Candidatus Korarchaeota archaeon NZ13-K]|nr:MAG: hypothetical protein BA066_07220 [Candidatus Korarchaeota archaeon NZ13-K]